MIQPIKLIGSTLYTIRLTRQRLLGAVGLLLGSLFLWQQLAAQANTALLQPDFVLNGAGENVDTIAFWEAPRPEESLMLVTAKDNSLIEVWPFPFATTNQGQPIRHDSFGNSQVNGVVVDQTEDLLYVSIAEPASATTVFSLPDRNFVRVLLNNVRLGEEPGIEQYRDNGRSWVYVTSDERQTIYVRDTNTDTTVLTHNVGHELETILADEYHQVIYVPDENGRTGIHAYTPELGFYERNGRSSFGDGLFQADAEGILLYSCTTDGQDNGQGFIVVSDQRKPLSDFEFFDRVTWEHVGTLQLAGVGNTDGIASTQQPLPGYPLGLFAAVHDDTTTAGIGWDKVLPALNVSCGNEVAAIAAQPTAAPTLEPTAIQQAASEAVVAAPTTVVLATATPPEMPTVAAAAEETAVDTAATIAAAVAATTDAAAIAIVPTATITPATADSGQAIAEPIDQTFPAWSLVIIGATIGSTIVLLLLLLWQKRLQPKHKLLEATNKRKQKRQK